MTYTHCGIRAGFRYVLHFFVTEKEQAKENTLFFLNKEDNRFLIKLSVDYTEKNRKYIRFCSIRKYLI